MTYLSTKTVEELRAIQSLSVDGPWEDNSWGMGAFDELAARLANVRNEALEQAAISMEGWAVQCLETDDVEAAQHFNEAAQAIRALKDQKP